MLNLMAIPVIYAHPDTGGHCAEVLRNVRRVLRKKGIDHRVYDLYKLGYDPVLHGPEHYTAGNRKVSRQNREFQKAIADSDVLMFICPLWWGGMPAILKGFFDRVMTPRFAFVYEDGRPKGLLKGKKAFVFTTGGGPKIFYTLTFNLPKRIIRNFILRFCGIRSSYHQVGRCLDIDDGKRREIRRVVEKALSSL